MGFERLENVEVGFSARDLWLAARQREKNQKGLTVACVSVLWVFDVWPSFLIRNNNWKIC